MAELQINGSFDEQWGAVKSAVIDHHAVLHGNGREGILDSVVGWRAQMRLVILLVALFGTLSTVGLVILGVLEYNHGQERRNTNMQNLLHRPSVLFHQPDSYKS